MTPIKPPNLTFVSRGDWQPGRAGLRLPVVPWANPGLSSYLSASWACMQRVVFLGLLFSRPLIYPLSSDQCEAAAVLLWLLLAPMSSLRHISSPGAHKMRLELSFRSTISGLIARGMHLCVARDHAWLLVHHRGQERFVPGTRSRDAEIRRLWSCLWYRAIITYQALE